MESPYGVEHLLWQIGHEQRRKRGLFVAIHESSVTIGSYPKDILIAIGPETENPVVGSDHLAWTSRTGHTAQSSAEKTDINIGIKGPDGRCGQPPLSESRKVGEINRPPLAAIITPQQPRIIDKTEFTSGPRGLPNQSFRNPLCGFLDQMDSPGQFHPIAGQHPVSRKHRERADRFSPDGDHISPADSRHRYFDKRSATRAITGNKPVTGKEQRIAFPVRDDVVRLDRLHHVALGHTPLVKRKLIDSQRSSNPQKPRFGRNDPQYNIT